MISVPLLDGSPDLVMTNSPPREEFTGLSPRLARYYDSYAQENILGYLHNAGRDGGPFLAAHVGAHRYHPHRIHQLVVCLPQRLVLTGNASQSGHQSRRLIEVVSEFPKELVVPRRHTLVPNLVGCVKRQLRC